MIRLLWIRFSLQLELTWLFRNVQPGGITSDTNTTSEDIHSIKCDFLLFNRKMQIKSVFSPFGVVCEFEWWLFVIPVKQLAQTDC